MFYNRRQAIEAFFASRYYALQCEGAGHGFHGNQWTSMADARERGFTQRDPSDVREFKVDKITKDSLKDHLEKNGYKEGDSLVHANGRAEIYPSKNGFAYSWQPKTGKGHDGTIPETSSPVQVHPSIYRNPTFTSQTVKVLPKVPDEK